jgi:hypothetical protein
VSRAAFLLGRLTTSLALVAMLGAGMVTVFAHGTEWLGSWRMALDQGTGSLALIGPVAAGWAALTYAGLVQQEWPIFAAGTSRLRRAWLDPFLVVWLAGVGALLLTTALVLVLSTLAGSRSALPDVWIVLEAAAVLAAQVGIGAAIGVAIPGLWSAPVAAVGVFALGPLSALGYLPGLFDTGSVSGSLVGQTWSFAVLGWQSLLAIGVAGIAACFLWWRAAPSLSPSWLALWLAFAASVVAGWSGLETVGHERYAYSTTPTEWVCEGTAPQVCMDSYTTGPLEAVAAELHRQAAALLTVGAAVPDTFDQFVPGSASDPGHGSITFYDAGETSSVANDRVISLSLATPRQCEGFSSERPPMKALRARVALADWIGSQVADSPVAAWNQAEEDWLDRPVDEQSDWVVSTYSQLAECDLDAIDVPY